MKFAFYMNCVSAHQLPLAKEVAELIEKEVRGELPPCSIGEWTAKSAAKRLLSLG